MKRKLDGAYANPNERIKKKWIENAGFSDQKLSVSQTQNIHSIENTCDLGATTITTRMALEVFFEANGVKATTAVLSSQLTTGFESKRN